MPALKIAICVGFALIFAASCDKRQEESVPPPPQVSPDSQATEEVSSEEVRKEIGEALKLTKNYIMQEKEDYAKQAEKELAELREKMREMEPKVDKLKDDSKTEAMETMAQMDSKIREISDKLKEAKKSENGGWEKTKEEMESSLKQLRNTVGQKMGEIGKTLESETSDDLTSPTEDSSVTPERGPAPANQ